MQELTQLFGSAISLIGGIILAICALSALLLNEVAKLKAKRGKKEEEETATDGVASGGAAEEDDRAHCTILYGTQTGTSEKFAKTLKSQLESAYGSTTAFHLVDAENYNAEERLAKEKFVIFIVATYGDGEPTDSALELHDYLKKQVEMDEDGVSLQGVSYAVFGLGNRQYEHFCAMGKKVQKWLLALGASPLMKLGKGDDDDDIDKDFDDWSVKLFQVLAETDVLEAGSTEEVTADSVPAYEIQDVEDGTENILGNGSGTNAHSAYLAGVTYVRELHTAESDRSCVHVEVDISGCNASYESGDHIGVYPENDPQVVSQAAKLLGESLDRRFVMRMPEKMEEDLLSPPINGPMTLEFALTHFADLLSSPSKASLKMLSAFASSQSEHDKLVKMSSLDGVDEYDAFIHGPKRSLLEVLAAFPSAKPSLGAFFGSISPRLQPRYYSISSSPKMHPSSVHITCAVVKETMPTGRVHNGVASTWLARLTPGQKIPIFLRSSSFKLPKNLKSPVIMVGPGTGLAPFRGFIQDRQADASQGKELGPGILYFGCRNRNQDYIYKNELEEASKDGSLTRLEVAFSREGKSKDYVQHHMAKDGAELWRLLSQKDAPGYLYICGDGKYMAKDVNRVLHDIVMEQTGCSGNEAEAIIKGIADQGRYLKDVW